LSADWTHDMILDDEELDRQHAVLFARLQTAAALADGRRADLEVAVAAFADELFSHVAREEALMDESLYPERVRHKSAHELFVADFLQLRAELTANGASPPVVDWIRTRIPEWLRFHIRVNDAPLAAHLARKRAEPGDVTVRRRDGRRLS
jgi:hemerythrin